MSFDRKQEKARIYSLGVSFSSKFYQIFGLHLMDYWDATGFDSVKFDHEVIKTPDGKSLLQVITEIYGQEAADLILEMLDAVMPSNKS